MLDRIRHEDFAPFVGRPFRFSGFHPALRLAEIDVQPRATPPGADRTAFTLIFHGPAGEILPAGFHRAEIEHGPSHEFYIMPIHTVARGRQEYQAVFN